MNHYAMTDSHTAELSERSLDSLANTLAEIAATMRKLARLRDAVIDDTSEDGTLARVAYSRMIRRASINR